MARRPGRPKVGLHKGSGRWRFKWQGRDHYRATEAEANAAIDTLLVGAPEPAPPAPLEVDEDDRGTVARWQARLEAQGKRLETVPTEAECKTAAAMVGLAGAWRQLEPIRETQVRIERLERHESERERQARIAARSKTGGVDEHGRPLSTAQAIERGYDPATGEHHDLSDPAVAASREAAMAKARQRREEMH